MPDIESGKGFIDKIVRATGPFSEPRLADSAAGTAGVTAACHSEAETGTVVS